MKLYIGRTTSLCFVFIFNVYMSSLFASEPMRDTLPPSLTELQQKGQLTVRALWAWNMVPTGTEKAALELRDFGHDLLGANLEQLQTWLMQAEARELRLSEQSYNILVSLISQMGSKNETVQISTVQAEPSISKNQSTPIAQDTLFEAKTDSAMYRGGVERTGVVLSAGPKEKPTLLWKFPVGEEQCTPPVVADDVAYMGSLDGHIYAVDLNTGTLKWKFFAEDWIDNPPAVASGVVYFGNVLGDGSGDRHLFALNAIDGSEKWRFKPSHYGISSSPAILDGIVYFGASDAHLYALEEQAGTEKWACVARETREAVKTPAIANNMIFFSSSYQLYAQDLHTGEDKWSFTAGSTITTIPVMYGGNVYFGSSNSYLYALDIKTGNEKWKYEVGNLHRPLAAYNGIVYACIFDELIALDAKTGNEMWKINTKNDDIKEPVLSGDILYMSSGKNLIALEASTGQKKWRFEAEEEITSPAVSNGTIYFWSYDKHLYAVQ